MSEDGDYTPAPHWGGYDFASARNAYKSVVSSSYSKAVSAAVPAASLIPESISSDAQSLLFLALDVTGSMGDWPVTICSKLPYLEHEAKDYLGDDVEFNICAFGDATNPDKYALQIQPFAKGKNIKESLDKLIHEGGGGGDSCESAELAALYYARNCDMPNVIRKPPFIFITDEGVHSVLTESEAKKWCQTDIKSRMVPEEVFAELKKKFDVFVIRKPYNCSGNSSSPSNDRIQLQWEKLLGEDHVVSLPEAERVVDVIFGILGQITGRYDDFEKELTDRQGKDKDGKHKIDVVLRSLRTIHTDIDSKKSLKKLPAPSRAVSMTKRTKGIGKKSMLLLEDNSDDKEDDNEDV